MARPLPDTLPEDEQMLMEERNQNPHTMQEHRDNWNFVYAWGWVSDKYYRANKLREILSNRGWGEDSITTLFRELFDDVPPFNPQADDDNNSVSGVE